MSVKTKLRPISVEEYLEGEQYSKVRHELIGGQAYAMVGASNYHNQIAIRLSAALLAHLTRPCRVFMSDMKVRVGDDFYYPDVVVSCAAPPGPFYFITDPLLVVEVLSESTERTDRHEKRLAYQRLPGLKEYVLVAQDRMQAEVYRRTGGDDWEIERFDERDHLRLESVDLTVPMAEIYQDVMNAP
jgi:Uma2 family endonuclease